MILDSQGNRLEEGNEVWFDLYNVEELYVRAHSTPAHANFPLPYRQDDPPAFPYATTQTGGLIIPTQNESFGAGFDVPTTPTFIPATPTFVPAPDEQNKCIVFVHGIALSVDDVACYTASFFKRLWWEGYRGRLAVYRWSTPLSGLTEDGSYIFSDGEFKSYHSALGLRGFVESLRQQMPGVRISIAAHSLGNACAGNALGQGLTVDSYVMLEAAMSLACYFPPPSASSGDALVSSYLPALVAADANTPTPNLISDQGYRGFLSSIHQNIANYWVNYHNDQDFWLATGETSFGLDVHWVRWNEAYKPFNPWGPRNYEYDANLQEGQRCQLDLLGYNQHRPVVDICEALAFVARSRTRAVGAEPASGNPLPPGGYATRNLQEYGFGTPRFDHSGQYQRNIQLMYGGDQGPYDMPLYRRIIKDLNME
jgi:pimeloyl-ACP methyl ester carboxylesterase